MKTERTGWLASRLCRALAGAVLALAVPAAQAGNDIDADWRELFAKGDADAIYATYALIGEIQTADGAAIADGCRAKAAAIATALQVNPVGLGLWYAAQECARSDGDEALAQSRGERFEALLAHALAGRALKQGIVPVRILNLSDAEAVVFATGREVLYEIYEPYDGGRYLVYTLGLWDAKDARETLLQFDYLDAYVQLQRENPQAEFPYFRREVVKAWRDAAVNNSPDAPLAQLHLLGSEDEATLKAMMGNLQRNAAAGHLMPAMTLAMICEKLASTCRGQAIDALLPLAEKRYAMALVTLAFLYLGDEGKRGSHAKAAKALVEQADQRLGQAQGSLLFGVLGELSGRKSAWALVEKDLEKAAAEGNAKVAVMLAARAADRNGGVLQGVHLRRTISAAEAGMPIAQNLYARHFFARTDGAQASLWFGRAAEGGMAAAQRSVGSVHYFGLAGVNQDKVLGLKWLKLAAHGGEAMSSTVVGQDYLEQGDDLATLLHAQGWLLSAVVAGDEQGGTALAGLYERDVEGLNGGPAQAAILYAAIVQDHDSAVARRAWAELLYAGARDVPQDKPKAESLLRGDAQKGVFESQLSLAKMLIGSAGTQQQSTEAMELLRKAYAAGSKEAGNALATAQWYGLATAPQPKAARKLWATLLATGPHAETANNFAWAVCTPADEALLDASAGLAAIRPLTADESAPAHYVDTLAACEAAAGDFKAAVATQERANRLFEARKSVSAELVKQLQRRLEQYRNGKREAGSGI